MDLKGLIQKILEVLPLVESLTKKHKRDTNIKNYHIFSVHPRSLCIQQHLIISSSREGVKHILCVS